MTRRRFALTTAAAFVAAMARSVWASPEAVSKTDFDLLLGDEWAGHLIYIDFKGEAERRIPVRLTGNKLKEGRYEFIYAYPYEPDANSRAFLQINDDGTEVNRHKVTDKVELADGSLQIVTTGDGMDNRRKATLQTTYILARNRFIVRKEAKYEGEDDFFLRNQYKLKRATVKEAGPVSQDKC